MGWQDDANNFTKSLSSGGFLKLEPGVQHTLLFDMEPRVAYTSFDRANKRTVYHPWGTREGDGVTCSYLFHVFNLTEGKRQRFELPVWRCNDLTKHLQQYPGEVVYFARHGEKGDTRYTALRCTNIQPDAKALADAEPVELRPEAMENSRLLSEARANPAPKADSGYSSSSEEVPF